MIEKQFCHGLETCEFREHRVKLKGKHDLRQPIANADRLPTAYGWMNRAFIIYPKVVLLGSNEEA